MSISERSPLSATSLLSPSWETFVTFSLTLHRAPRRTSIRFAYKCVCVCVCVLCILSYIYVCIHTYINVTLHEAPRRTTFTFAFNLRIQPHILQVRETGGAIAGVLHRRYSIFLFRPGFWPPRHKNSCWTEEHIASGNVVQSGHTNEGENTFPPPTLHRPDHGRGTLWYK